MAPTAYLRYSPAVHNNGSLYSQPAALGESLIVVILAGGMRARDLDLSDD